MSNIRIEKWMTHEDAANTLGYVPINNFLNNYENIIEVFVLGDEGEYLALTNEDRLLYVSHWYGDSENITVPNVARTVESIVEDNTEMSVVFRNMLWHLLDRHYIDSFVMLPDKLRARIEQLIKYKKKTVTPVIQKNNNEVPRVEYVYFLTADNGLTKIGRTINLDKRIHHFTTKLPYELTETLILETNDCVALECELHNKFASKRIRGEWFNLSREDINWAKNNY